MMKSKTGFKYDIQVLDANVALRNPRTMKVLRKLTLHPGSGMNSELDMLENIVRHDCDVDAYFILAKDSHQRTIAWALLSEEGTEEYLCEGRLVSIKKGEGSLFEVYVRPEYRRQGIGQHLFRIAKKIAYHQVIVVPWDETSNAFYKKHLENGSALKFRDL